MSGDLMPRRRPRGDDGFTLAETLVVVMLLGILGAIAGSATISSLTQTRRVDAKTQADASLRTALEQVSRELRVADPLRTATANSVSMDVGRGGACQRRTYALSGTTLTETVQSFPALSVSETTPGCTGAAGGTTTRTVARDLVVGAGAFTYTGADGTVLSGTVDPEDVAAVAISLTRSVPEGRPASTLTTSVELRNYR